MIYSGFVFKMILVSVGLGRMPRFVLEKIELLGVVIFPF
jgi:hypothetical protein